MFRGAGFFVWKMITLCINMEDLTQLEIPSPHQNFVWDRVGLYRILLKKQRKTEKKCVYIPVIKAFIVINGWILEIKHAHSNHFHWCLK